MLQTPLFPLTTILSNTAQSCILVITVFTLQVNFNIL